MLAATTPGFAQTNTGLLTDPWHDGQRVQLHADLFTQSTTVRDAPTAGDDDTTITVGRTRSRVRLAPIKTAPSPDPDLTAPPPESAPPESASTQSASTEWETAAPNLIPAVGLETVYVDFSSTDDPRVPARLVREEFAVGLPLNQHLAGDWQLGATIGVGHASSQPWADAHGQYALASVFGTTTLDDGATLLIGLTYDGNRSALPDTPLPVLEYRKPLGQNDSGGGGDRELGLTLGYPESRIIYRHSEQLSFSAGFDNLDWATAEMFYEFAPGLALTARYAAFYDMFHAAGDDEYRRLFFISQRLEAGLAHRLGRASLIELSGGYAFGQELRRGYDWRRTQKVAEFDDAVFVRLGITLSF